MTLKDLGERIREKREAAGLSIDDVAAQTKVSGRILTAIENGSMEGLPHTVYTKGFVRSFATVVGFDPEELGVCLERVFPPETLENTRPEPGPITRARPVPGAWKRMIFLMLLVLILTGIAGGIWYVVTAHGEFIWETVKKPFSAITTPAPDARRGLPGEEKLNAEAAGRANQGRAPASPTASSARSRIDAPETASALVVAETGTPDQRPLPGQVNASQAVQGLATSPAPAGVDASGPARMRAAPQEHHATVEAQARCWIRPIRDGVTERDYIMDANVSTSFTFKESLELQFGHPKVVVTYNGDPVTTVEKVGALWVVKLP